MEKSLKEQLHLFADKLENYLFGGQVQLTQDQIRYFQSFFVSDSYVFTSNLIKYFKQELCVGFAFNIILVGILVFFIPSNFNHCWESNSIMALWLIALGILNTILVLPKSLLLHKLFQIDETADIYVANYTIWNFFRSKVYNFNMIISRYIFCTYIVGTAMFVISWVSTKENENFYMLISLLLISFILRILTSFYRFVTKFGNPQQAEDLFELFNGTSSQEIQSLKVVPVKEYSKKFKREEDECPICYEKYSPEEEVRVMSCPGDHAFHKKCIDKWLIKSNRCPKCNLSIFWQKEENKKNK